jgi:ribosome-associated heat shock protein Hsp15
MVDEKKMRLDRWLWAARFFKTRALAVNAIKRGQVTVNGQKSKPARLIAVCDELLIRKAQLIFKVTVRGLSEKRVGAALSQALFSESTDSIQAREQRQQEVMADRRSRIDGRPTKKNRRAQQAMKRQSNVDSY